MTRPRAILLALLLAGTIFNAWTAFEAGRTPLNPFNPLVEQNAPLAESVRQHDDRAAWVHGVEIEALIIVGGACAWLLLR